MIDQCANPTCGKPLHYLRDGKVFVFALPDTTRPVAAGRRHRRLEHFWLCGDCSQNLIMVQTAEDQIQVQLKLGRIGSNTAVNF